MKPADLRFSVTFRYVNDSHVTMDIFTAFKDSGWTHRNTGTQVIDVDALEAYITTLNPVSVAGRNRFEGGVPLFLRDLLEFEGV